MKTFKRTQKIKQKSWTNQDRQSVKVVFNKPINMTALFLQFLNNNNVHTT